MIFLMEMSMKGQINFYEWIIVLIRSELENIETLNAKKLFYQHKTLACPSESA